jgi:hypothetical protein
MYAVKEPPWLSMATIYVLSTIGVLSAVACAPQFAEADFVPYSGEGLAMLEGQAYVEFGINGPSNFRSCFTETVFLAPATAFDQHVINMSGIRRLTRDKVGPASPYWRDTICDSQGRFVFNGIPAGNWFVITRARYEAKNLVRKVALHPGQNVVIIRSGVEREYEAPP